MDIYLWLTFYLEVSPCVQAIHSLLVKLRLTKPYDDKTQSLYECRSNQCEYDTKWIILSI